MKIDHDLLNFAKKQSILGRKIAIATNNMDIFSSITMPYHKLNETFNVIVNSADYGLLKADQDGKIFDIVMKKIGINDFKSVLLIDDSLKVKLLFEAKGGNVFTYDNFKDFIEWAKKVEIV